MNRSTAILNWMLSLLCLILFGWSTTLAFLLHPDVHRSEELQKTSDSLLALTTSLPKSSIQIAYVDAVLQNLRSVMEGTVVIEQNAIRFLALLALIALALCVIIMLSREREKVVAESVLGRNDYEDESDHYLDTLEQTIEDLTRACQELEEAERNQAAPGVAVGKPEFSNQFDQIVRIESYMQQLRNDIGQTLSGIKEIADKLQRLSTQSEDAAHFSSATRLEWNAMGSKLRQIKEFHDKIKGTVDKIGRQQNFCNDLIIKNLDFGNIHSKHSENAREQVTRMNDVSRETLTTLDLLANSMEESDQDVTTASQLVRGLSERAEEIVNIIDVIDDIAEQTNQLALNASIEAARAGEQGQGFAVVAGEVRSLAARSSTATKSITDLLGTIQAEADHASACLEKSKKSVEIAHSRMLEVDRSYREAATLSRQTLSELNQLITDVSVHMQDLKSLEKQTHELRKYYKTLSSLLEEHGRLSSVTYSESNQLTVYSDRLSRLLNRQFFEVSHCDRLIDRNFFALESIKGRAEEGLANSERFRTSFHQLYIQTLREEPIRNFRTVKLARIRQILKSVQKNIEVLRSPNALVKSELATLLEYLEGTPDASPSEPHQEESLKIQRDDYIDQIPVGDVLIEDKNPSQKVG